MLYHHRYEVDIIIKFIHIGKNITNSAFQFQLPKTTRSFEEKQQSCYISNRRAGKIVTVDSLLSPLFYLGLM